MQHKTKATHATHPAQTKTRRAWTLWGLMMPATLRRCLMQNKTNQPQFLNILFGGGIFVSLASDPDTNRQLVTAGARGCYKSSFHVKNKKTTCVLVNEKEDLNMYIFRSFRPSSLARVLDRVLCFPTNLSTNCRDAPQSFRFVPSRIA